MKILIYYKNEKEEEERDKLLRIDQVKRVETTKEEIIITIEKRISRYAIKQAEIIEQFNYGEEIHTIEGKD